MAKTKKFQNDNRSVGAKEPGMDGGLCDTDSDCAALGRRLKLEDQSGGPSSKVSKGDQAKLDAYRKSRKGDEAGRHQDLEAKEAADRAKKAKGAKSKSTAGRKPQ